MPPLLQLPEQVGNWTVLKAVSGRRSSEWLVRCVCGTKRRLDGYRVRHQKSCGCKTSELIAARNRKYAHPAQTEVYLGYKRDAKKRDLKWALSREFFLALTQRNCHYCGVAPFRERTHSGEIFVYNGVDRVNSAKGYTKRNVVPCCLICNRAKSDSPVEVFLVWAKRIFQHQSQKPSIGV